MNRTQNLPKLLLTLILIGQVYLAAAQTKYWTGGNGLWDDASKWSAVAGGPGGAGVPRVNENVVIAPQGPVSISFRDPAWCNALRIDGSNGRVRITGSGNAEVNIAGAWQMSGQVEWNASGPVRMVVRREGVEVDTRGSASVEISCSTEVGPGPWSVTLR
ncbi:MAG: hypothetical protein R2818_02985 [Flavobacteriales bacterium]